MNASLPPAPADYELFMPLQREATNLQLVGIDVFAREVHLAARTAAAWKKMEYAAQNSGVSLLLLSGFRSIDRQREIVRKKLEAGISLDEILCVNAYPGHSEHHTGRATDIGSNDAKHFTEEFAATAEFAWLFQNAGQFGFSLSYPRGNQHRIAYEPWHWFMR